MKGYLMIKIGLGQIEVVPGNPRKNKETILNAIAYAKAIRIDLLILPELCISGYMIGDLWEQPSFLSECEQIGQDIIAATEGIAVIFGNVGIDRSKHNDDGRVRKYNALFAAQNGTLVKSPNALYDFTVKTLGPNYRFFNEERHFYTLPKLAYENKCELTDLLQPLTFSFEYINGNKFQFKVGPLICEDSWDDNYMISPTKELATQVDLLVNISSSPFTLGKANKRHRLFQNQTKKLRIPLAYVNAVGIQNNGKNICTFDGQSTLYNADSHIVKCVKAYESTVVPVKLDEEPEILTVSTTNIDANTTDITPHSGIYNKTETASLFKALQYGIKKTLDYYGLKKVVIGISGGIDSAVNAALYSTIVPANDLYLVSMPSRFNSTQTKDMAAQLAKNLNAYFAICPIEDSIALTNKELNALTFTRLDDTGEKRKEIHPITALSAENIQARDRSSRILAAIAANMGGVFTCNGNKTEFSIGYATLYGDLAGFLAATADCWKYQIYALAEYMNGEIFKREVIPYKTIEVVPSAELSDNQDVTKGLGDPLQYEYHDRLLRTFIENWNRTTPEDILDAYKNNTLETLLELPHPIAHYFSTPTAFIEDLERWWNLQSGFAIAKRIQSPPLIVVSRRAYGGDLLESQLKPYYTEHYYRLKTELLK